MPTGQLRLKLYGAASRVLPKSVRRAVGKSSVLEPLRNRLFRPKGTRLIVSEEINFEGLVFSFSGPIQVVAKAKRRGIEATLCRLILEHLTPGAVCIDVGASYGFLSCVMALSVQRSGHLLSFEADPTKHAVLVENLSNNRLEARAEPSLAFVGSSTAGDVSGVTRTTVDHEVAVRRFDRLDVLKIDVDGPELEVLRGAERAIERFHPLVVVELPGAHEGDGHFADARSQIVGFLEEYGYDCTDMQGRPIDLLQPPPNVIAKFARAKSTETS